MEHIGDGNRVTTYQTMMDDAVSSDSSIGLHCQCDYNHGNYTVFAINCILPLLVITYFGCAQHALISKYNFAGRCLPLGTVYFW